MCSLLLTKLTVASLLVSLANSFYLNSDDDVAEIVGGDDAVPGTVPYQVALYANDSFYCGGALIGLRTVLTAAQCIHGFEFHPSMFIIRYGNLIHSKGMSGSIKKIIKHPSFTFKQIEYDLAIIHLDSPITVMQNAFPIQLTNKSVRVGSMVTISGWGKLGPEDEFPNVLQVATGLQVISTEKCKMKWGKRFNITPGVLCAQSLTQSACHWDSGSPVTQNGSLVGLVSFGSKFCLEDNTPNGYADVAHHRKWILDQMLD